MENIDRDTLTKIFISQLGERITDQNIEAYSHHWWFTVCNSTKSLRLSKHGFQFLKETVGLESFFVKLAPEVWGKVSTIIYLERTIKCPYFITPAGIFVFSQRIYFELTLHDNDITLFGKNKAKYDKRNLPN